MFSGGSWREPKNVKQNNIMSEAAIAEAPPAQSQSVGGPTATSLFAQQMADLASKEVESSPEAAPETTPDPKSKPEVVKETTAEAPKEATLKELKQTATEKQMAEWTQKDFDEAMKKAPSKAWKVYEFYKNKNESKLAEAEKKLAGIEAKPASPENDKKIELLEKQIRDYTEQLSGRDKTIADLDYTKSEEFQKNYVAKYNRIQTGAAEEFKRLTITEGETQRPATEADFKRLMKRDIGEQFELVKQWFGDSSAAYRLLTNLNLMDQIQSDAMDARETARQNAEQSKTKAELQTKEEGRLYESQLEARHVELADQFPELFGDTDNQEASTAFQKGLDFAKRALSERMKMSPAERAEHDALLIQTHAGFRRLAIESKAKDAEVETLKKELARYRKSDPGNAGDGKAPAIVDNGELGGIAGMSSMYKKE